MHGRSQARHQHHLSGCLVLVAPLALAVLVAAVATRAPVAQVWRAKRNLSREHQSCHQRDRCRHHRNRRLCAAGVQGRHRGQARRQLGRGVPRTELRLRQRALTSLSLLPLPRERRSPPPGRTEGQWLCNRCSSHLRGTAEAAVWAPCRQQAGAMLSVLPGASPFSPQRIAGLPRRWGSERCLLPQPVCFVLWLVAFRGFARPPGSAW